MVNTFGAIFTTGVQSIVEGWRTGHVVVHLAQTRKQMPIEVIFVPSRHLTTPSVNVFLVGIP